MISSENNLRLANDKARGLSIRKLTRNNPTMKAAIAKAREECAPPDVYASRLGVSAKVITMSNAVKATTNGQRVGLEMLDRPMMSELASAMAGAAARRARVSEEASSRSAPRRASM